jgi:MoaA/NifB/PqqE/SkfB family radical SAM enzyme
MSENSYTSTGVKLAYHPAAIADLHRGLNHPIVLHIMPTEICNLECVFCSVAQRGAEGRWLPDLTMTQINSVVTALSPLGLKAVILSGGGDPTLYKEINALIYYLSAMGLEIGMITNGILLRDRIWEERLRLLKWIRISANTLDYRRRIDIPPLPDSVTLGFSYIWNPLTTGEIIGNIRQLCAAHPVRYVRVLSDCQLDSPELDKAQDKLAKIVATLGPPFFHQNKRHAMPAECHLGRVHPVLYTDGYIYPCDSVVLNSPKEDKKFHSDYAICRWDGVREFYRSPIAGSLVDTRKCPHCVFAAQNGLLTSIVNQKTNLTEPSEKVEHVNFV